MGSNLTFPAVSFPRERVVIVTGGNTGIGYVTAKEIAMMGATVIIACRSQERALEAISRMNVEFADEKTKGRANIISDENLPVEFMKLDLGSLKSTVEFIEAFQASDRKLHCLICNAGIGLARKEHTVDGYESMFQTNYLGHFLIAAHFLPIMKTSGDDCRMVFVSSLAHRWAQFNLQKAQAKDEGSFNRIVYYGNSKVYQGSSKDTISFNVSGKSKDESVAESQGSLTNSGSRSRHSSASSSSSNDVIPSSQSTNRTAQSAEERPFHEDESLTQSSQKKKRIRMSKKEIHLYEWSDEMIKKVADFVKDHEQLFDKRHREWLNKKTKTQVWTRIGSTLEPCATGDQCKKLYKNMRTRVGKILNKNKKSGSGANEVTPKDAEIMETWDFLGSHTVRGNTNPSEDFGSQVDLAEEQEADDLSTTGSATGSVVRAPRSTAASSVISASAISQRDLGDAVHELLSKADTIGKTVELMGHNKSVHDFACLLEGHMQSIPEDNWHGFELACLTLVHQYRHAKQQQQPPPHPFEYTGVNQWARSDDYMGSQSQGAPEWSQTGGSGAPRWSAGSQYSIPLAGGYQSQYQASSVTSTPRSSGQVFMAPATPVRSPQPVFTTPS